MNTIRLYTEDLNIAKALIRHDESVTKHFFYRQCYPLFKSIFDNYYTDCTCCKEFIDEIYILVLAPSRATGKCQMENFRGESTLTSWLKSVCLFYCYKRFEKRENFEKISVLQHSSENKSIDSDSLLEKYGSSEIEFDNMNRMDIETLIGMMSNERYRRIIQLRYVEHLSNEETAEALGMTMANYYNKHKLAKAQFLSVSRKEASHG
ncbi:RNA polymerase sigma factor [Prevotella sp. P4-119]|uniref:RNA polymerase sigma factor n=1 Tax=Prevotella sp. P4-119 TaxID=2024218 RepID=UPI000BDD9FC6|nr:sigma-70 family RNA polymerase sigma factor [Prevotella sp. P4-119]OYP42977.1 hypothetical protein CIK89_10580 [Prevotella sp. P4-119]